MQSIGRVHISPMGIVKLIKSYTRLHDATCSIAQGILICGRAQCHNADYDNSRLRKPTSPFSIMLGSLFSLSENCSWKTYSASRSPCTTARTIASASGVYLQRNLTASAL